MYIYGAGKRGNQLLELIKDKYNKEYPGVLGFIDERKSGEISGKKVYSLCEVINMEEDIIISLADMEKVLEIYNDLKNRGFQNVYYYLKKGRSYAKTSDLYEKYIVSANCWGDTPLLKAETHIVDWCNLNCKGCAHYSPIFERVFPAFDDKMNDAEMLKQKFSHIISFHLLGGEPLLNPELDKYCEGYRRIFKDSDLWIVTNGLLIPSLEDRYLNAIRENEIVVCISEYEPTHKMMDKIIKRLDENGIAYEIRAMEGRNLFNKPLTLSSNTIKEKICISANCVNIYNGMISRCPQLMYIDRFNTVFGTELPIEGRYYLKDCPNGKELLDLLQQRVPLCEHCVKNEMRWERCSKAISVEDFACFD